MRLAMVVRRLMKYYVPHTLEMITRHGRAVSWKEMPIFLRPMGMRRKGHAELDG
jgi:hypothetical protein